MKKNLKNKGWTLVELLVVISIIIILSLIALSIFTQLQRRARNVQRRGDLKAIQNAMEMRYDFETGQYPSTLQGSWFEDGSVPTDPRGRSYRENLGGGTYSVCVTLEAEGPAASEEGFCVESLQES